jgi:hypothetical protein
VGQVQPRSSLFFRGQRRRLRGYILNAVSTHPLLVFLLLGLLRLGGRRQLRDLGLESLREIEVLRSHCFRLLLLCMRAKKAAA